MKIYINWHSKNIKMKKIIGFLLFAILISCGSSKTQIKPLFEILAQKNSGGASIPFFEIITEANEFVMIKNDPELKNKIKATDIQIANFLILNVGEKPSGGYGIEIENVIETEKNIIITTRQITPKPNQNVTFDYTSPFLVVKINSKKEIIFEEK